MIIYCPNCGRRHLSEFTYEGDASIQRPSHHDDENAAQSDINAKWYDYVYARKNGVEHHAELWHHGSGCRQFFVAIRNLRTHEIERTLSVSDYQSSNEKAMNQSNIGQAL